ncbi:MAG: exopolysaccharide biosynthesis polyprenyl glycosylphosphotransferase [Anaerolineae bacterium]
MDMSAQKLGVERRILSVPLTEHRNILYAVDGLLVLVALLIGLWLGARQSSWVFSLRLIFEYSPWFIGVTLGYFVLASANDAYRPRVASDPVASLVAIGKTVLQIFALYLLIYALLPPWSLPRHFIGYFTVISPLLLVIWRRVYSKVFVLAFKRKAVVVGAGWSGQTIAKTFQDYAAGHFELIGFVDDDPAKLNQTFNNTQVLGSTADLPQIAAARQITDVVMAISRDVPGQVLASLMLCYERGVQISTMTELYERLTDRVPVEHVGNNWFVVLPFSNNSHRLTYRIFKRGLDILLSLVGLALFALLFPFLALALYLDSPGDVFYRQRRVGRGGQLFELVKLRSMVTNAEQPGQAVWADQNDARVTRVGRWLRRTRLDEAPQLFNVLRGEMSIIGPRPERPEFVTQLEQEIPFYRSRLTVKPGLTGWAQVNYDYGRNVVDALEKLRYDLYYIKHQSAHLDVIILLKTVNTVLMLKGT